MSTTTAPTAPPPVTITPLPEGWTYRGSLSEPTHRQSVWIYVVLDVPTRALSVVERLDSEGFSGMPDLYNSSCKLPAPGGRTVSFDLLGAPSRMGFMLKGLRTRDDVNSFLDVVRPLAEEALANMTPVPDTVGQFDWTVAGLAAAAELDFVCGYPFGVPLANELGETVAQQRAERRAARSRGLVDATALFALCPDLVEKTWAGMDDEHLNQRAADLTRFLIDWRRERDGESIYTQLGVERNSDGAWPWVRLVGVRAFMYGYRRRVAGNLTVQSADRWYEQPEYAARIHANLTDAEVTALAEEHTVAARCDGLLLVGAPDAIRTRVIAARRQVRDQFPAARAAYAAARAAFEEASRRRSALLAEVIGWGMDSDTDAALAKDSGMSHTGVRELRKRLLDPDGITDAE